MPAVPAPGQLVTLRQRRCIVVDVQAGKVPADVHRDLAQLRTHHLVIAQALDDDGGEADELQVIWEIEPGAAIHERAALPDPALGFDRPEVVDAFLDAVRWGAIATADHHVLHAPFRSGITIEDYQLDPVARALEMPRVNLLVADDVGLGKTIEAGLVVQELLLRHRARTVLVACPAGLQIQWRDQMRDKFGLEFKIVDAALLRELRRSRGPHVNPWSHHPRLITSIDYLKRERPLRLLRDLLPAPGEPTYPRRFDLLIVDEAHNVAPAGRGHYAVDSQRTMAIRALAPHFEHKLFLSATPHNGYPESFAALLELLDDQRFHRGMRKPDPRQLAAIMVRRLKRELPPDDLGRPRFPERRLLPIEIDYPNSERHAHAELQRYVQLRRSLAAGDTEGFAAEFVLKLLKKRLFSSPEAFKLTLERHIDSLRGVATTNTRTERPSRGLLEREIAGSEEENADDDAYEAQNLEVVDTATRALRALSPAEDSILAGLLTWATRASTSPDAKASALLDFLAEHIRPGGQWSDTRVIIFTEYRATQNWLLGLLAARGFTEHERTLTLYGGMDPLDREKVKAAFQADPAVSPVRILLATDAASEGIDLQNHCSRLIHYELPWNPSRMEQRNGRVDRHGQRASEVQVFHFVGRGFDQTRPETKPGDLEGDLEFLMRIALRVDQIREDLGSVGDLLAAEVEAAMLGRPATLRTTNTAPRSQQAREVLKIERALRTQLERLRQNLEDTRQALQLAPDRVQAVVELGLRVADQPPLRPTTLEGGRGPAFHVPPLMGSWAACAEGLAHPHTGQTRPIVFDPDLARGRDDVILAHLGHRLVQMCARLLRAEVWAPAENRRLRRSVACVVPTHALEHPVLLGHARLVLLADDGSVLHEELVTTGGHLREGRFARFKSQREVDHHVALAGEHRRAAPDSILASLTAAWPKQSASLIAAFEALMRERSERLTRDLAERADREATDLEKVLRELLDSLRAALDEEPPQLDLFDNQERDQLDHNREAMHRRAEALPAEIERETAALRARYKDPQPRFFPVALTFLLPERLTGSVR